MADLSQIPTAQLLDMLHGNATANGHAVATEPSAPAPPPDAFATGRQSAADESPLLAGIHQAAQQATLGGQNYINAAIGPGKFSENLAYSRGQSQGESEAHPVASTIGGVLGGVAGSMVAGGALGKALESAPSIAQYVLPAARQAGQRVALATKVANVAKSAAGGAVIGGAQAANEGQQGADVGLSAAGGAVGAPFAERVMGALTRAVKPAEQKAWQALADIIHESPDDIRLAAASHELATGQQPGMAGIMDYQSRGALKALAAKNPTIAAAAIEAERAAGAPAHEQLAALQGTTRPQTEAAMQQAREQETTQAMQTPDPRTGISIGDTPVNDPKGVLKNDMVQQALRPATRGRAAIGNPAGVPDPWDNISSGSATVNDLEAARQGLRNMQAFYMRPPSGVAHPADRSLANAYGDLANQVEQVGKNSHPDYGTVLGNDRYNGRYINGFTHGLTGKSEQDYDPADTLLKGAMNDKEGSGQAGYAHGNALARYAQAIRDIAPGSAAPAKPNTTAGNVAQGAMALASGGISSVYHGMKAIPHVSKLPQNVQDVIAKQLFNPQTRSQGLANLSRAGANDQEVRNFAAALGQGGAGRGAATAAGLVQP